MGSTRPAWVKRPPRVLSPEEKRAAAKWRAVRPSVRRSLRRDFKLILEQCLEVIACHDLHEALFGSAGSLDVVNRTAPEFFNDVQDMLYVRWILNAYKLGDAANAGRRDTRRHNMSVRNLDRSLLHSKLRDAAIRKASKGIYRYWRLIRAPRNKIVAHADRRTYRGGRRLGDHDATEVTAFLQSIRDYCDAVGRAICNWPGDLSSLSLGDAGRLLSVLQDGLQSRD